MSKGALIGFRRMGGRIIPMFAKSGQKLLGAGSAVAKSGGKVIDETVSSSKPYVDGVGRYKKLGSGAGIVKAAKSGFSRAFKGVQARLNGSSGKDFSRYNKPSKDVSRADKVKDGLINLEKKVTPYLKKAADVSGVSTMGLKKELDRSVGIKKRIIDGYQYKGQDRDWTKKVISLDYTKKADAAWQKIKGTAGAPKSKALNRIQFNAKQQSIKRGQWQMDRTARKLEDRVRRSIAQRQVIAGAGGLTLGTSTYQYRNRKG